MEKSRKESGVLRLLLLEDNPHGAELAIRQLKEAGFHIAPVTARSSEEFKSALRKPFDLILADYGLPDWNGLDAVRWLRSSGILTPFILLTGTRGEELAIECIKAGADDYILKESLNRLPLATKRALAEQQLRDERDWAEKELRESENQYRLLFHSNPHPMWVSDSETLRFLAVNNAAVHHYGYEVSEFLSMTVKDVRLSEDTSHLETRARNEALCARKHYREVSRHKKKDGTIIDVETSSQPITYKGVKATLVLAQDVTEQQKLEQQLRYAQKMEAVGRLAGGVAHDFNNLLVVISSHVELMKEYQNDPARMDGYARHISSAIDSAAMLTKQLLAFGRRQIQDLRVFDLNSIVTEFCTMLPGLLGPQIKVVVEAAPDECPIYSDRSQVEQVIMNLVVNARDAMAKGGKLTIETARLRLGHQYFQIHGVEAAPGEYAMLAITDTGMGMDRITQTRIFEPFFTTKPPGKGTGLGLSTVYGIVKQSAGYTWVYSELGVGTTFKVYLPLAEHPAEPQAVRPTEGLETKGYETVLLVEDESALRIAIFEFMKSRGYHVLAPETAFNAIRTAANYTETIHLLITDLVMPGLGGVELAEQILALRPGIKIIYMSGYPERTAKPETFGASGFYIQKPFTLQSIAETARRALDSVPGCGTQIVRGGTSTTGTIE